VIALLAADRGEVAAGVDRPAGDRQRADGAAGAAGARLPPGSRLLSARMCAKPLRATPATRVKAPPTYQPPAPSAATAYTLPLTSGEDASYAPLLASMATPWPVRGPTRLNVPPMYTTPPRPRATAKTSPSVAHVRRGAEDSAATAEPATSVSKTPISAAASAATRSQANPAAAPDPGRAGQVTSRRFRERTRPPNPNHGRPDAIGATVPRPASRSTQSPSPVLSPVPAGLRIPNPTPPLPHRRVRSMMRVSRLCQPVLSAGPRRECFRFCVLGVVAPATDRRHAAMRRRVWSRCRCAGVQRFTTRAASR
jgi:hypothetical protein